MTTLATLIAAALVPVAQSANQLPENPEMTSSGWIFFGTAWVFVIGLAIICLSKAMWGGKPS